MKLLRRNGLKGHQHLAQGIALGRRSNVMSALKGHKPYLTHHAFALAGRLGGGYVTQGDALGWEPTSLSGCIAEPQKLELNSNMPLQLELCKRYAEGRSIVL